MNYKITNLTKTGSGMGVCELTVTFDDGSKYDKRMMVPFDSEDSVHGTIRQWLSDYMDAKSKEVDFNSSKMKGKSTTFTLEDLPKTSVHVAVEAEQEKAKQKALELQKQAEAEAAAGTSLQEEVE